MKLTYLGTAAAEGFPAIFCNCEYCNEARRLGGKNIRTRSQAIINDDLLIDFPPDTYAHFLANGIRGDKIKHLIVTHSHHDHLFPEDFDMRHSCYAHNVEVPTLHVYCSSVTAARIGEAPPSIEVHILNPYETVALDGYEVTALPARHMPGGEPFIYIIRGDKTLLYANDTGFLYGEVLDYIKESGTVFDMVSLDCTYVGNITTDEDGHMGLANNARLLTRLEELGAINEKTVKYVNHFSHNGNPLHHLLEGWAAQIGCLASYDGLTVEF